MKPTIRAILLGSLLLANWASPRDCRGQEPSGSSAPEWTAEDTRLANQYLRMLEARPDYSKVLELLWSHYLDHEATPLLMEHFRSAADESGSSSSVRLVYAHLLRRAGEVSAAAARYEQLIAGGEQRAFALAGLAEIALEHDSNPDVAEKFLLQLTEEDGAEMEVVRGGLMATADLYLSRSEGDAALRVWRLVMQQWPGDLGFLQELAARMINAGYLAEAIAVYESLRNVPGAEHRIAVLVELGRLYELANEFEPAAEALNEGRAATHFKHHTHLEFLSMLVRLYERHDRLDELEEQLLSAADGGAAPERNIFTLVRFFDLTARTPQREKWLRELVSAVPGRADYKRELVEVLISSDQYLEARERIEELLAADESETLSLRLLRVRVELNVGGRDAGASMLQEYLSSHELDEQERGDVLNFAEEQFLDEVAEQFLRDRADAEDGEAVFRLVNLHHSRGRIGKARAVLDEFIDRAGADAAARADRLFRSAAALQSLGLGEASLDVLKEAVALQPGNRDYLIRIAEFEAEAKHVNEALENYEIAWSLSETDEDRADIDQRIYSLLQLVDLQSGVRPFGDSPGDRARSLRRSAIFGQNDVTRPADPLGAAREAIDGPGDGGRLLRFYAKLQSEAAEGGSPEDQLRTARWAKLLGDYPVATELLGAYREANPSNIRAERLLLEVAEASKQTHLALRQLELLARLDPENQTEYELRRALIQIGQGDEKLRDDAFANLVKIAGQGGADASLLKQLAGVYGKLGRHESALEAYRRAFEMSTLHEKRSMIPELNRLQVQSGRYEDALETMTRLIQAEHDLLQRRKQLTSQLSLAMQHQLLDKLKRDYEALQRKFPLEPFFSEALSLVSENLGNNGEAFAAIKKAYYGSRSRDEHLLERMRQLAAKTRDVEAAIYYQKQVVTASGERAEAPEWHKLIRMLEMDLQVAEADRIRVRLESKFAQDPDVLQELADYYLKVRQPVAARRVLSRMVRLRPWHVTTLMRVGMLEKEAGNYAEAAGYFLQVLEHTSEIPGGEENLSTIEHFPTRGFSKGARPELSNQTRALDRVVAALDDTRLIDNRLRVQLAHYFESGRPEYQPVPDKPRLQRLRAIEELGELSTWSPDAGIHDMWTNYWMKTPPRSIEERFWIAWSAGENDESWRILEDHALGPITAVDEFLICLYGTHANRIAELTQWVGESDDLRGERRRRLSWLLAAIFHATGEKKSLPPDEQLITFLESGLVTSPHVYSVLNLLNKAGLVREALHFGELARDNGVKLPAHFEYSLATLAHNSGDLSRQRAYLEAVIGKLDPSGVRFQEAAAMLYEILPPGEARFDLARGSLDLLGRAPENPRVAFGRARILALAGDREGAAAALREVVALHLGQAKSIHPSLTGNLLNDGSQWNSLFDYAHSARRLGLTDVGRESFAEAISLCDLVVPRSEQTAAYFQHFLFQQILWEFEDISFLERKALLQSHRSLLRTNEEWEALARTLAGEGFHRDTIGIYHRLLGSNPLENDYARAFLNACASAREHEPALEYLNRVLAKELPPPEGASGSYFQQQHAFFLAMGRKVDRLRAFAAQQRIDGPALSPNDRYYHHSLSALLADRGDFLGALEVFTEVDDGNHHNATILRNHARVLRELGRPESAIRLLERAVPPGRRTPARPVMEDMAELYSAAGDTEKLRQLTLSSLENLDDDLAVRIAGSLAAVDMHRDAEGVLLLALRRVKGDAARFRLLVPAIDTSLSSGSFERAESFLEVLCACDIADFGDEMERLLEVVRSHADGPMAAQLDAHFARWESHVRGGALAGLCRLELALAETGGNDKAAGIVMRLGREGIRPNEIAAAVDVCLRSGAVDLAKFLVQTLRQRHQPIVTYAPQAIRYFSAAGDSAASADLFQKIRRNHGMGAIPIGSQIEIAEAYAACGDGARAAKIFKDFYERPQGQRGKSTPFLEAYRTFLVERGDFLEARNLLRSGFRRGVLTDPGLIADFYDDWGRPDRLSNELEAFDLSSGTVLALNDLLAKRQNEKEPLSKDEKPE